jgi:hypothetical protein
MQNITWNNDRTITITPPKKFKKITGTHFPAILKVDPWSSEFEKWCRCTRTYEKPFTGNKYSEAGQILEPKVFEFLRKAYALGNRLKTPTDIYGKDYFKKTWGDFFPETEIFGGSWDALIYDESGANIETVVEVKTVLVDGRSGSLEERWVGGKAPHYQALQASLYGYLLGIDNVMMVSVSLREKNGDYDHPETVIPSHSNGNIYIDSFKISERYPDFEQNIEYARQWWEDHVVTGISPEFDEKKDAEILKALRTNTLNPETDLNTLIAEGEELKAEIDRLSAPITPLENRLKIVTDIIKQHALTQFRDGDKKVSIHGNKYEWSVSRTESTEIDKDGLKADGLLDKYTKAKTNYRITTNLIKEEQ